MSKKKDKSKSKKKFTGQVSLTRARKIFIALGFGTAGSWNEAKLTKKIQKLPDLADGVKLEPKMQKRVNTICNWLKDGKKVVVINLDDVAAGKKRATDVEDAVKREDARKKEKKEKTQRKTDKAAGKKPKRKGPKKIGVIASILEFIQKGPISKKQILAKLKQRFPDRPEDGMAKTIQAQLPKRMSKEKGIKIKVDDKGRFLVSVKVKK